jgi:5-methylcytosine-specific restriction endonuclease McrA
MTDAATRPKRKAITPRMKIDCLLWRAGFFWDGGFKCAECQERIMPSARIEWDHTHCLAAGGPHEYMNLRPLHYECHKDKTKRDVALNSKAKRIARGGKRKGPGPRSRGFQPKPDGYKTRWPKRKMGR